MNRVTMSGNDGFWARVRAVLGRNPAMPAYGQAAIGNADKKSRPAQRIDEQLRRGWAEAGQRQVSLCVLAMEMDRYAEYFSAYGRDATEASLDRLQAIIAPLLPRETVHCLRNGRAGFVLVLPDMPVLMARELASRIATAIRQEGLPNKESHTGQVTLSMGLAVTNPHGGFDRSVLNNANQAVKRAQRRGLARLEVVDLRGKPEKRSKAA
ncbi:diguanylate cyclase [Devosia sp. YIM 151766]|uniref:diguanylate cyclase domain-containing protein n=1 Tax=Devosia sp. YIM 151766 TaxID=3017325 RepID=UPI00255CB25B|nr:diguanylate cyclase [Devosia sp. YIM 151766]WIY53659.1 diguanylate cyclase [Devosia sp. YIM 151766]